MTKQVQRRRGTATQHTSFTGAEGEISVNTTNKSVHVHDGVTAGGVESARADLSNVSDANLNSALSGNTVASLTITSADINGGTIDGTVIGGSTPAAISGTTITGTSFVTTGDMTFGDNDKAIFGAGSDLQIYHDGSNSYIADTATGSLHIKGTSLFLEDADGNEFIRMSDQGSGGIVYLKNLGATKLATTATGIDVTGTVTADGLTVDGDISATGGAVDLDTLDLNAIAATKAVTAVDVFVYDTSKDSDGGAWRKRTQGTSWYNETLNTATRGGRKEFPAVAVIVAETSKVTIYDGDDPSLPMWMVFTGGIVAYLPTVLSLTVTNGKLCVGGTSGLMDWDFLLDRMRFYQAGSSRSQSNISTRGSASLAANGLTAYLVNTTVNDVAMTVLPDAPLDPATGLPVPTIAVATAGGVSVIKDDGTVVDSALTSATSGVYFTDDGFLLVHRGGTSSATYTYIVENITADGFSQLALLNEFSVPALVPNSTTCSEFIDAGNFKARGGANKNGVSLLALNSASVASSMVAYTTSTYNTGWMNGNIKGAFLSDTDATSVVGSGELVTNGTFDTDTSGWSNTSATIASVSGELQVSNQTGSPSATTQTVSGLVVGKVYAVTATYSQTGTGGTAARVSFFGILSENNSTSTPVTKTIYATATQTTATLSLQSFGTSSTISHFDNVSVKLADADRSVNNKGLIVNGTVTRTAVATGADLVAYSGFSASNYLEQPYNSGLDFGTGDDFCIMGWLKTTATIGDPFVEKNPPNRTGNGFQLSILSGKAVFYKFISGGAALVASSGVSVNSGQYSFVTYVRKSGILSIYVNGVFDISAADTTDYTNTSSVLFVGRNAPANGIFSGSLALLRISATAPTAEQIAKIYNDEKFLFQDNAQATLYGASDAVTALAHDDATNLLHVGTSAGRSVFQGLRRVENTTTAVGTAISASNSLVVEE
jgi:trimeric autotransporter adhesin